jgi:4-hydroxybenzoyl-CoA thioesterase/acyl-CoA thioester hydrolase
MAATYSIEHLVQFCETDMAGIVHFSNYFRMMEEVEHHFFRSLSLSVSMHYEAMEISWPRIFASCEYAGPLKFEDVVELVLRVTKVGNKSLTYEVDFINKGKNIGLGKLTSVCCTMKEGKFQAIEIPAGIRAKLLGKA